MTILSHHLQQVVQGIPYQTPKQRLKQTKTQFSKGFVNASTFQKKNNSHRNTLNQRHPWGYKWLRRQKKGFLLIGWMNRRIGEHSWSLTGGNSSGEGRHGNEPIGDGTRLKKGKVVVEISNKYDQEKTHVQRLLPMSRTLIWLASLQRWAVASWDMSTAFLCTQLPEDHILYCGQPNVLVRLSLVEPGVVWKLNKALYGLRTSPKAWKEERDEKLQNLIWNVNGQQAGLCKVDTTNYVGGLLSRKLLQVSRGSHWEWSSHILMI